MNEIARGAELIEGEKLGVLGEQIEEVPSLEELESELLDIFHIPESAGDGPRLFGDASDHLLEDNASGLKDSTVISMPQQDKDIRMAIKAADTATEETKQNVQAVSKTDDSKEHPVYENADTKPAGDDTEDLENLAHAYDVDLRERSECPDTIPTPAINVSNLEKISPEENAEKREEFAKTKNELKQEWELENGRPWPKYKEDVYSESGKLIRKAGSDYDAHHIQPLGMGGKNEASNITPLHAMEHYDKQGIHSPDSPYSKMEKLL